MWSLVSPWTLEGLAFDFDLRSVVLNPFILHVIEHTLWHIQAYGVDYEAASIKSRDPSSSVTTPTNKVRDIRCRNSECRLRSVASTRQATPPNSREVHAVIPRQATACPRRGIHRSSRGPAVLRGSCLVRGIRRRIHRASGRTPSNRGGRLRRSRVNGEEGSAVLLPCSSSRGSRRTWRVCQCRANNSLCKDNNSRGSSRDNRGRVLSDSILRMIIRVKIHLLDRARICSSSSSLSSNIPRDRKIQRNILVGANKTTVTKLK
jgi:hypothetical protein